MPADPEKWFQAGSGREGCRGLRLLNEFIPAGRKFTFWPGGALERSHKRVWLWEWSGRVAGSGRVPRVYTFLGEVYKWDLKQVRALRKIKLALGVVGKGVAAAAGA